MPDPNSPVRAAIMAAARELFSAEGFRAVSADKVIAASGYSKVTFYRHFPTKDELVAAFLADELARLQALAATVTDAQVPELIYTEMCTPGFRGCPFLNAAAEYPAADHPTRAVISEFRDWMRASIGAWLERRGVEDAQTWTEALLMLRDGAMFAGYLDGDPERVMREFAAVVGRIESAAGGARAAVV